MSEPPGQVAPAPGALARTANTRSRLVGMALVVLALVGAVAIVGWVFLDRYRDPVQAAPAGSDTPQHLWRAKVVTAEGLDALPSFGGHAQALNTNADRPGLPLIAAIASSTGVADPDELVYVLPAVIGAVTGLAAAGFARAAMDARGWSLPAYALGVGASVHVSLMANGYLDQLLVMPLLLGAAACVLAAADEERVRLGCAILLGAAFAVHWQFAGAFAGLLFIACLAHVPRSVRAHREGTPWKRLPAASMLASLASGLAVGVAALLGAAGVPRTPLGVTRESVAANLRRQLPLYRLPFPAAAGVGGAVGLAMRSAARRSLALLLPWALVPAAAAILYGFGRPLPVQRALTFALAIPILAVASLESLVRLGASRFGRVAGIGIALVAVVALMWSGAVAREAWITRPVSTTDERLAQLSAVAAYIAEANRPAIVVVDLTGSGRSAPGAGFGSVPMLRRLRAQLEPTRILDVTAYLGDPSTLVEGRPTLRPAEPGFDETSLELWAEVRPLMERDPVILVLRTFHQAFGKIVERNPGWQVASWLAVPRGPRPSSDMETLATPRPPGFGSLIAITVLLSGLLLITGAGWSIATGPRDGLARACLAPATGLGALVLAAMVVERLGIRAGERGAAIATIVAIAGLLAAAARVWGGAVRRRAEAHAPREHAPGAR